MPELIADPNVNPKLYSRGWFRLFEILPGALVWTVLILPFLFAKIAPDFVTIFVLVFDMYWILKSLNYGIILLVGYRNLKKTINTDWNKRLLELPLKHNDLFWEDLWHVVILPTYKEPVAVLEASIQSVVDAKYNSRKIIFVLATEARDAENAQQIGAKLTTQFAKYFHLFLVTKHPDGIVGEVKAKGANATWAAKQLVEHLQNSDISFNKTIVTTADADSRFHPEYFARLSYSYMTAENRLRTAFQPVPMYFNNIWDAPMISRIYAFGTTFWNLVQSVRTYRLITFATHAMALSTLIEMDYWCTSIVNEDSRQFYRGFFHFNGRFKVIPLFIPIYMDAVHAGSFRSSLHNLYLQQQRWAYGVEHFPYIVLESWRRHKIPLLNRLAIIWRAFEGNFNWATSSYFITIVGWIPFVINHEYNQRLIALNYQNYIRNILIVAWVGLFISIYLTLKILPHPPAHRQSIFSRLSMIGQWILVPVVAIFFSSIPAIDSQTRLMLGKYLGFRVTAKVAVKNND